MPRSPSVLRNQPYLKPRIPSRRLQEGERKPQAPLCPVGALHQRIAVTAEELLHQLFPMSLHRLHQPAAQNRSLRNPSCVRFCPDLVLLIVVELGVVHLSLCLSLTTWRGVTHVYERHTPNMSEHRR